MLPPIVAELPDPGESLGLAGEAYKNDYEYKGLLYDLYRYSRPDPADLFIQDYTSACEVAGWSVGRGKEGGEDALYLNDGEVTAILLYDYQGYMLLMIPEKADFTLHADVQPVRKPVEIKANTLCFDYNGRHYEGKVFTCSLNEFEDPYLTASDSRYLYACFNGFDAFSIFSSLTLSLPVSVQAGDSFSITMDAPQAVINNLCFGEFPNELITFGMFNFSLKPYCGRNDYFTISVQTAEHTNKGYLVEGTFDCDLASENSKRHVKLENGTFSFCVRDY